ncbi:MAG: DUF488 domain-containing protein [Alphaproteobacteria bacterium]|uniref:DUF488 domain-containing protein n=1 Tax=Candidatus Nitrobium versatile TaxID=2884831 RepID=A0A953M3Y7_9BACT|nr:DUF488 domain-containing protein [Candidatus Nitrobium versatile]
MHLFTAQIGKYRGPDAFDVTVKSGNPAFAPTWDLVRAWKSGKIDWDIYTQRYRQLMLQSYRKDPGLWHELLHRGIVTLLCYCRAGEQCHRYLLANFLRKLGEREGVVVVLEGERTPQTGVREKGTKSSGKLQQSAPPQTSLFQTAHPE